MGSTAWELAKVTINGSDTPVAQLGEDEVIVV